MYIVRNILAALLLSLVVLTTSASAQGAPPSAGKQADARAGLRPTRIAVFDSRVVFDSMPERSRAESELALAQAQARVKLEAAKDSLRAAVDELAKFEQTMSMREREAVTLNLRARELLVEETVARLDQDVQRAYVTLRQPMVERLRAAVRAVREKEGYDLLLDLASEGLMLEASPSINLTSLVLRELRKPVADARHR
ncbi:OmpH family outer membrane protein [Gemmatimonas sp.]|uniref:OmpH family outer membrane protein n=1 Tax=Gemmatimonas sp. TaxID=1962908 RepID=UPI00333E523A